LQSSSTTHHAQSAGASPACVAFVRSAGHDGLAVARHPDDLALDAGVQIAAAAVLDREGVEVGQQGHRRRVAQAAGVREA
jgi:hypothetical protein